LHETSEDFMEERSEDVDVAEDALDSSIEVDKAKYALEPSAPTFHELSETVAKMEPHLALRKDLDQMALVEDSSAKNYSDLQKDLGQFQTPEESSPSAPHSEELLAPSAPIVSQEVPRALPPDSLPQIELPAQPDYGNIRPFSERQLLGLYPNADRESTDR
jgi:hypothetical protein